MTLRLRRMLVAIRDERRTSRAQLRKAAAIAKAHSARVELFHAINEPEALDALRRGSLAGRPVSEIKQAITVRSQTRLQRLANLPEFRGLKVSCMATWDFPPHEAIIRRVLATNADLVVAAAQPQERGGRLLLANTDWELIRHCPCAVLLVKSSRSLRRPVVLAAVDPFHAHDKPAELDGRILRVASSFARQLNGTLHLFHAYMPLTVIAPTAGGQPLAVAAPLEADVVHTEHVTRVFDALAKKANIPPRRRHLQMGVVVDELKGVTKRIGADVVVMGAVSRSGLRRFFIGSTAERVLDRLDTDILIVKPRDFVTRVPKRTSVAWLEG